MNQRIDLQQLLTQTEAPARRRASFALLTLGVAESLAAGALSPSDAVRDFFNADNCLYVAHGLGDEASNEIMSRGVQLTDLFDALSEEAANRELDAEIARIRALGLTLLKGEPIAA
jgi:hypothetical protein